MDGKIQPAKDFAEQFATSLELFEHLITNSSRVQDLNNEVFQAFALDTIQPLHFYIGQVAAKFYEGSPMRKTCFQAQGTLKDITEQLISARAETTEGQRQNPDLLADKRSLLANTMRNAARFALETILDVPQYARMRERAARIVAVCAKLESQ